MIFPSFETKRNSVCLFFFCYLALALQTHAHRKTSVLWQPGWARLSKGDRLAYDLLGSTLFHSPRWRSKHICSRLISTLFVHQVCRCSALLSLCVCVYTCVCERERLREIESERQRHRLFLVQTSVLRDPWTVHVIMPREWFEWIFGVQQRSRSHAWVACKAKRLQQLLLQGSCLWNSIPQELPLYQS